MTTENFFKDRLSTYVNRESGEVHITSDWDEVIDCMNDFAESRTEEIQKKVERLERVIEAAASSLDSVGYDSTAELIRKGESTIIKQEEAEKQ